MVDTYSPFKHSCHTGVETTPQYSTEPPMQFEKKLDAPLVAATGVAGKGLQSGFLIWGFPERGGTPKSSILVGFSLINHPFWGTPIYGNLHVANDCDFFFAIPNRLSYSLVECKTYGTCFL